MTMHSTKTQFSHDAALETLESAVRQDILPGLKISDPMLVSLIQCLKLVDWERSEQKLYHALPHFPAIFALEDFRNVFHRLGVVTRISTDARNILQKATGAALLLDSTGNPYVIADAQHPYAINPLTGEQREPLFKRGDRVVTFYKSEETVAEPTSWFVGRLLAMRHDILLLCAAKLAIALISLVWAFGIVGMYSVVIPSRAFDTLTAIAIGLLALFVADFAFRLVRSRIAARIGARAEYVASTEILAKILALPLERLGQSSVSAQAGRAKQLANTPGALAGMPLETLIDIPIAVMLLAGLAFWNWQLALLPLVVGIFCGLLAWVSYPVIRARKIEAGKARSNFNRLTHEMCHGLSQIHADGNENHWLSAVAKAGRINAHAQKRASVLQRRLDAVAAAAVPVAGGLVAVFGTLLAMNGTITNGALLAAMIISWRILSPVQSGYQLMSRASEYRAQISQINTLMELSDEQLSQKSATSLDVGSSLTLQRVQYRYPNAAQNALNGVNISIPPNSLVALTGPSGAGKTTLLKCVNGLCAPGGGQILIGGINAQQIPVESLRSIVAYVPNKPALIHGTVAQNLRLARPTATDQELEDLCSSFGLTQFIEGLPDGINTRLTATRQKTIPQGTVHVLAVVQAVLRRPRFLLLDDTADAVDADLEKALMKWLSEHRENMTILMATHRPSHVRVADYELKFLAGKVSSFGPPERLN